MPRKYIKIRQPPAYSIEDLKNAVNDIINCNRTYSQVEQFYGIPRAVVYNRVKGRKTSVEKIGAGRPQVLNPIIEQDIENCLKARARMGIPCNKEDVKDIVEEYVKLENLSTPFPAGRPGDDWYYSFIKRHPTLSVKKPELLQKCRKDARDPFVVYEFYDELTQLIKDNSLEGRPEFIFNCDESGFPTDPKKLKAIGEKGRPLSRISGGSGRESVSVLATISADGYCLPPLIVFKGVGVQVRWISTNNYPGTKYSCSKNGWMEEPQFFEWFSTSFVDHVNFLRNSKNMETQTALLLFDGHCSHISIRIIKTAMQNNIHLMKLPSHLTDKIQPLDKAVFGPLKKIWDGLLIEFIKKQVGSIEGIRVTKCKFSELLGKAWELGMKPQNIKKGFLTTGIYPVDKTKFPVDDFNPSALRRYMAEKQQTTDSQQLTDIQTTSDSNSPLLKDHSNTRKNFTPNTIINIFAEKIEKIRNDQVTDNPSVKRQVFPRLKPAKYGEILTAEKVIEKMETAEMMKKKEN